MDRRGFVVGLSAAVALPSQASPGRPGRLSQGVARSVFGDLPLDACCKLARSLGLTGFDFIDDPKDWAVLAGHGMTCSMLRADYGGGVSVGRSPAGPRGWAAIGLPEAQGEYLKAVHQMIDLAADHRFPNVFVSAGSRDGVGYERGADNAVAFLDLVKAHAESRGVTVCLELLNSKGLMAPPNSLFDKSAWGFDVMRRVNSPRVRVLYDIWHAQLSEGNIVDTLRRNIQWIGHIHTGGVPDRHELQRNDELDYRFIAQVLAELKFQGYVVHEWSPSPGSNVADNLRRSVALMTV